MSAAPSNDDGRLFYMKPTALSLFGRFEVPPFTVLDRRAGYWQELRSKWLSIGFDSGEGREEGITYGKSFDPNKELGAQMLSLGATSIFDPVLAHLALRWYSSPGDLVYDPFGGGSVRGIVAAILGRRYIGVDIRREQIEANERQAAAIDAEWVDRVDPTWVLGDGCRPACVEDADMVLTCPPYGNLEVYSKHPRDISNMKADQFASEYEQACWHAVEALRQDRYSVWVVGNYRDKQTGAVVDLAGMTIRAHQRAGAALHCDGIILNPVGSLAFRASQLFPPNRRLGRAHQHFLVFLKGDAKAAADRCQPFDAARSDEEPCEPIDAALVAEFER